MVGILSLGPILNAQCEPWLTGPLIAPVGTAVPYGDFMVKSYLYFTANTGFYDKNCHTVSANENFYTLNAQFLCFFGLTPWCDLNIIPQFFYNTTSNQHSVYCGDLTVGLDFQLMAADFVPYLPGVKFTVREVFPTGNFRRFSPRKLSTDQTGAGTFATQFDLIFYKLFHLYALHWLSATFSAQYTVNTPVNVHGFNAYGGGFGADGKALPGNSFQGIASFEVTLNKNWVLAIDNVYTHTNTTPFFGIPGIAFSGTFADIGKPSSEQLSFAPAIEYHFSNRLGIIGGCWFSAWGRNSTEFRSSVVNVEYTY
ncbi:MAG: hypothetical protein WCF19_06800 [Chlamydiales bacterium]